MANIFATHHAMVVERILSKPPDEPHWLQEAMQNTTVVYVDTCGDFVGNKWEVLLEDALSSLPNLQAYLI